MLTGPSWFWTSVSFPVLAGTRKEFQICWLDLWLLSTLSRFNPLGSEESFQLRRGHGQSQSEEAGAQCLPLQPLWSPGKLLPSPGPVSLVHKRAITIPAHSLPSPHSLGEAEAWQLSGYFRRKVLHLLQTQKEQVRLCHHVSTYWPCPAPE